MLIKINVLGVKEGVGKTTVSISLGKKLSKFGKTLVVDKTPTCGLWRKFENKNEIWCEDTLCILKLFKQPFRINEKELEIAIDKLAKIYRRTWDYVVIDNFSCAVPDNPIIKIDMDSFPVFVTDPLNIKVTLEYSNNFYFRYGLIVNQAFDSFKILPEVAKLFQFSLVIPIINEEKIVDYLEPMVTDLRERTNFTFI
ncbi:hypothetical protein [Metallosphaera hakonensis]|uniref:Cobalamin biosynthesis protein CobQ n=1 Tax=Metallosphaera hakonensis JCM 8857 = DSM 7519 TaxID=1293036 RepID=A0A2U9IT96_9CREN|nr:hypothetical protein [Metallosphaera hakonensis]AWR99256.1 ParA family protein [Metallosphaera hakonensis JCM 8857 = DSM 7519]